jgi:hypothetical protein
MTPSVVLLQQEFFHQQTKPAFDQDFIKINLLE